MKTNRREPRLDANGLAFFERQLTHVKAKAYDVRYPELKAAAGLIIPISNEAGPGIENINYRQYDMVGMAKLMRAYGKDLPRADVSAKEFSSKVRTVGTSYGYTIDEIENAQVAGVPLDQKKANAARRANDELVDRIAFEGDTEFNIQGMNNNANMTEVTIPNDGSGSSKTFASKTADQIIRDLNDVVNTPNDVTNGLEFADTLLLPVEQHSYIASTPRASNSDTTILQYFLRNNPFIKAVIPWHRLNGAGVGGDDRMIAYRRDPDYISLEIPVPFEQRPQQEDGLEFVVPCRSRFGGVIIYYPLATAFADGI